MAQRAGKKSVYAKLELCSPKFVGFFHYNSLHCIAVHKREKKVEEEGKPNCPTGSVCVRACSSQLICIWLGLPSIVIAARLASFNFSAVQCKVVVINDWKRLKYLSLTHTTNRMDDGHKESKKEATETGQQNTSSEHTMASLKVQQQYENMRCFNWTPSHCATA